MSSVLFIVIPAAGLSRRMGQTNKLLEPIDGYPTLIGATVSAATATTDDASNVVVVTGHEHEAVAAAASTHDARIVRNPHFKLGMGASIKAGVAAVSSDHAVMIWPADMPFVRPATVHRLVRRLTHDTIVRPVYHEAPGHPVLFGSNYRKDLLGVGDEDGARGILDRYSVSVTLVDVDDPGVVRDFDTKEDFNRHA